MKICPRCHEKFEESSTYCPKDGAILVSESGPVEPVLKPKTQESYSGLIVGAVVGVILLLLVISLVAAVALFIFTKSDNPKVSKQTRPIPGRTRYPDRPPWKEGKLKFDIKNKVKGSFGRRFLKVMVTNVGKTVVKDPGFSITMLKKDVKMGTRYGRSDFFLRPQQTIPIWIDITNSDYTSLKIEQDSFTRAPVKEESRLFPEVEITETKMSIETGILNLNGRRYEKDFYRVTGIVKNKFVEEITPQIFVVYYDDNSEIVGIANTSANKINYGEKAAFKVSKGEYDLFGKPKTFKIIVVDRSY